MRRTGFVVILALFAGCQETPVVPDFFAAETTGAGSPAATFYWLPPLPAGTPAGEFNPDLHPRVVVCLVVDGACSGDPVAEFTRAAGTLEMDAASGQYQANWKTDRTAPGRYRISVRATTAPGSEVLGSIELIATGSGFTSTTGEPVRNSGANLPIKFGVGRTCEDCVETVIGAGGGIVTLPGEAQVNVPAEPGRPDFTMSLSRWVETDGGPCLPLPHPQYEGCYRILGEYLGAPGVRVTFSEGYEATLFMCMEAAAMAISDELWPWKWDEEDPSSLQRLEASEVPPTNFECAESTQGTASVTGWKRILAGAGRTLAPVARLFQAGIAHAQSGGSTLQGFKLRDLSRAGWVHEPAIAKTAGDGGVHPLGAVLTPTVRVTSKRLPTVPIPGVPVQFLAGDGSVVASTTTDANGYASTSWQLGTVKGVTHTLQAEASNYRWTWVNDQVNRRWAPWTAIGGDTDYLEVTPQSVTFTAQTAQYAVTFLTPLGTVSSSSNITVSPLPTVEVCRITATGCDVIFGPVTMRLQGGSYQASWDTPASLQPGPFYKVRVRHSGAVLADVLVTAVSGGTKTRDPFTFEAGRTLPIKVTLQ